jgi:hypothetical protein
MSSSIRWHQFVKVHIPGSGVLHGPEIVLPVEPFPGLCVGEMVVNKVMVLQGGDPAGNCIEYMPITLAHAEHLQKRGWERRSNAAPADRKPQRPKVPA